MKLVKNFLWNAGYQIFILIVPLVTIPYINRVLGPTGVGINSYTNSIVQYFILIGSLGINTYGNREIAYHRDSPEKMSRTFWEIALLRILTIAISVILYLVFIGMTSQYRLFYLLQGIMLIGTAFDISWFFMGIENFKVTVLRNALVKILSLVLIFGFVKTSADTWIYVLIMAASQTVGYLTLWPYLRGQVHHVALSSLRLFRHVRPSVMLLIPQMATQIYLQLNKTMLGVFQGVEASGFYDNSDKIIKILLAIITATGTVLLPHVAHSFAKGDHQAVKRSLQVSMHVILVLAVPMAAGLAALSEPFTVLFFSERFMSVAALMAVESLVIILIGISNAVGVQYLLPTNQLGAYTTSVVLGSVVNIVLNVPLILIWGTMGAIVATVLSEATVSIYQLLRVRKQLKVERLFTESWKYVLSAIIMYICLKALCYNLPITVWAIGVEVVVGFFIYASVLFILVPRQLIGYVKHMRD
ncbi:flippase (plasmid) [Lactiplantibacillus plantarum]|uniref:flippase n=1 Tax=Lactiplantibacillus plantarum TaxID=1590 RepID=UPI001A917909|nr:flippase [Lactiplantibacillus plantarum]QSW68494.1 flippase [Lactiplantibacillus plantarum]WNC20933.1 flippase [Lactiplantibacillus plantarum]